MTRRALTVIVLLAVLGLAAGFSAAAVVYDRVSRVGDCAERFGDNSPAAWSVRGITSAVPDFDGTHLFVADYREVLILRKLEGMAFDEVSRRMGRTTGAVRVLWFRAIDRLRQLLVQEGLI